MGMESEYSCTVCSAMALVKQYVLGHAPANFLEERESRRREISKFKLNF